MITVLRVPEVKHYLASEFCSLAGKAVFQQQASSFYLLKPTITTGLPRLDTFIVSVISKYKSHAWSAMLLLLSLYHMQQHISFVREFVTGQ